MNEKHPANSINEALQYPLATLKVNGWNSEYIKFTRHLKKESVTHHVAFTSEDLTSLVMCIENSELIAPLPSFLANAKMPFKSLSLQAYNDDIEVVACVATTHRNDPFYQWLVTLVKAI
ncbi:MAG: DNA-binding transcriptional LysR family regulator [Psychromonas sp.]|jgi:DNA-binding transcriptional LysR family regulator